MTNEPEKSSQADIEREKREARLAKNLRDNLRRRKAASRKTQGKNSGDSRP